MQTAGADLAANQTAQCALGKFVGPPIFHQYAQFCPFPNLVHDYFRDVIFHSPLAHVAAQLLGAPTLRMINGHFMGSEANDTLPLRWHADYTALPGGGRCDNGLVMWLPLERSWRARNGMLFAPGSHRRVAAAVADGTLPRGLAVVEWCAPAPPGRG